VFQGSVLSLSGGEVNPTERAFVDYFGILQDEVRQVAVEHGWEEGEFNVGEKIALMHSELSEALEYERTGARSDHIPAFQGVEEEFADVIIRIMHYAQARGLRVAEAIIDKNAFNRSRPHKRGGKKF
jgi:NTP pyrophosphatase (non-canonical NTP hydrolase)